MNLPRRLSPREYRALDAVAQVRYLRAYRAWLQQLQEDLDEERRRLIDKQEELQALRRLLRRQSSRDLPRT